MLRTNTALLHPSPSEEGELHRLSEASARLWNRANYQRRQAFFHKRRTPSYPYQCNYFKDDPDFRLLGTCRAQALLQKLAEAWASFFELLQLKKEGKADEVRIAMFAGHKTVSTPLIYTHLGSQYLSRK